jgi:hypothetical protein
MNQTHTSKIVMRRVRTVHALRPFISPTAGAAVLFAGALWGIGREVWVAHVLSNLGAVVSPETALTFVVSAFVNTRFIVQVLTVLAGGAFVWLAYEMPRVVLPSRQFA